MILFIGIVLFSLVTGNCLSCPLLERPAPSHHSCCPHQGKPKPSSEKKDCPSELFFSQGFAQADGVKVPTVPMGTETVSLIAPAAEFEAAHVMEPESKPHAPPGIYLLNSVLLI